MKKWVFCLILVLLTNPVWSAITADESTSANHSLEHADGLSTDISGANQSLSICAWVRRNSSSGVHPIGKYDFGNANKQYSFRIDAGVLFMRLSQDGSTNNTATGATALTVGTWYHACTVYNDTDIRLYLNGSLDSNGASNPLTYSAGIFNGTSPFVLWGYYNNGTESADPHATASDLCVWNTALTAAQVASIASSRVKGNCAQYESSNLQLYCSLDDCKDGATCTSNTRCYPDGTDLTPTGDITGEAESIQSYM